MRVTETKVSHNGLWTSVNIDDAQGGSQRVVSGGEWKTPLAKKVVRWVLNPNGDPEDPNQYTKQWVTEFYHIPPNAVPTGIALAPHGSGSQMWGVVSFDLPTNPEWYTVATLYDALTIEQLATGNNFADRINSIVCSPNFFGGGRPVFAVVSHIVRPTYLGPSTSSGNAVFGDSV